MTFDVVEFIRRPFALHRRIRMVRMVRMVESRDGTDSLAGTQLSRGYYFTVMESIVVISMVIIGGAGSRWGRLVGAIVLVILPEVFASLVFQARWPPTQDKIIYGALLVIMMMFRPRGLVGKYGLGR